MNKYCLNVSPKWIDVFEYRLYTKRVHSGCITYRTFFCMVLCYLHALLYSNILQLQWLCLEIIIKWTMDVLCISGYICVCIREKDKDEDEVSSWLTSVDTVKHTYNPVPSVRLMPMLQKHPSVCHCRQSHRCSRY